MFFVATPALLLQTLAGAPIQAVLSRGLAVTCLATTVAGGIFVLVARLWWKRTGGTVVIGALGVVLRQRRQPRDPAGGLRFR